MYIGIVGSDISGLYVVLLLWREGHDVTIFEEELLGGVVLPWLTLLREDIDKGFETLLEYDEFFFRAYPRLVDGRPHEVIEFVRLICSQTNQYDVNFPEIVMQTLDIDKKDWVTFRSGIFRMTRSAAALIGTKNIYVKSRVDRVAYLAGGRVEISAQRLRRSHTAAFDAAAIVVSPSAAHSIIDRPKWSFLKEQSIRGMH